MILSIALAKLPDIDVVRLITHTTIKEVYPRYYPEGAVSFFLSHHSIDNICDDISRGLVFLCFDSDNTAVGTVTVKNNEICRLFVLPQHQGKGYGKQLLDFCEEEISKSFDEMVIDASLSAKGIYLKRGYRESEYRIITTENGDLLCYDVMKKQIKKAE